MMKEVFTIKHPIDFLKECSSFFVLTLNESAPAGRPFGAIMEHEGRLYIATSDMKDVYRQLRSCSAMQIVALKAGTREWLRLNGHATECNDPAIKQKMLEECPVLTKHYTSPDSPYYCLFAIEVSDFTFY